MMQLKAINVRNFRKFIEPAQITGLVPGINIISGDNEDGKSTIVAAIKAALYTKHSTSATQTFQPYNSAALAEVELDFDLDGISYRLKKTFGKKGTAELRGASAVFNGSEAEEKLQDLLSLGSEKTRENTSIWNVLWVEQGTAFLSPQIGEVGKRTLSGALENELGRIVSGDEGNQLLRSVGEIYQKWFTEKSGKHAAGSEYSKLRAELDELDERHSKLEAEYELYRSTLEEIERVRQELLKHDSDDSISAARKAVETARLQAEEVGKQAQQLATLKALLSKEQSEYQAASEVWRSRSALIASSKEHESVLAELQTKQGELERLLSTTAAALHECQQKEESAEQEFRQKEQYFAALDRHAQVSELQGKIEQRKKSLAAAQELQQQAASKEKSAQAIKIDRHAVERLRDLDRKLAQAEAQLEIAGTKVEFQPQKGNTVFVGEAQLETDAPLLVTEQTEFALNGWGSLIVVPGGDGIDKVRQESTRLQTEFTAALSSLAVKTVAEAEEREREKTTLHQQANEHLREVLHHAPKGPEALTTELTELKGQLTRLTQAVSAAAEPAMSIQFDSAEAAALAIASARGDVERLKQSLQVLRQKSKASESEFTNVNNQMQLLSGKRSNAQTNLNTTKEKLAAVRAQEADEKLEQRVMESKRLADAAQANLTTAQEQHKGFDPAAAQLAVTEANVGFEKLQQSVQSLRERQSELSGKLQTFGKAGITEEFQKSADKRQHLTETVARLEKRAAAVKLLYETLNAAEQKQKSGMLEPILNHLEPYVKQVFDQGSLMFDSTGFGITGLRRQDAEEQYDSLSLGTREQLSVLMRLAFAHVLSANNCPALVILDDALVYSDQIRFEKMQKALEAASASFQILILTCRVRDWQNMQAPVFTLNGGKTIEASVTVFPGVPGTTSSTVVS